MQQPIRPYAAVGVAVVGASMIAVAPVAISPLRIAQLSRDVELTAVEASDFIGVLAGDQETSNGALVTALTDLFFALGHAVVNPSEALHSLPTTFAAATFLDGDQSFVDQVAGYSNDAAHTSLLDLLTASVSSLDPGSGTAILPDSAVSLVNMLASPLSGAVFGQLSPLVAAVVPFLCRRQPRRRPGPSPHSSAVTTWSNGFRTYSAAAA